MPSCIELVKVTGVQRRGRSAGVVGKCFTSDMCLPQCIWLVLLAVGQLSRLLQAQCFRPCPSFLTRVSDELLSTLCCFRGSAVCPGTVLTLQLLNYLRLLWSQDLIHYSENLRIIFSSLFLRDPKRLPFMFFTCSLFSQLSCQVSATLLAIPSSCLLSDQVAAAPGRPPMETSLCPRTTRLMMLSWKLLPAPS